MDLRRLEEGAASIKVVFRFQFLGRWFPSDTRSQSLDGSVAAYHTSLLIGSISGGSNILGYIEPQAVWSPLAQKVTEASISYIFACY